jgi:RimJ/RimL family protein N-acetyltransferase
LREPRLEDFGAFAADAADPIAHAHIAVSDARDTWRRFLAMAGHWPVLGMGWWVVEERDLAVPIGAVGVFRREANPQIEIGWAIHRAYWKRGYASEAARAALDFATGTLGARRVIAHIAKDNEASIRVATKLGMRREGEVDFYGETDWLYVFEG